VSECGVNIISDSSLFRIICTRTKLKIKWRKLTKITTETAKQMN